MTDHSLGQLCHKLEIGTSYIRKCLPFPELVEKNLNHWIENTKNKNLMVRTKVVKLQEQYCLIVIKE